jgi:hypothetical protein
MIVMLTLVAATATGAHAKRPWLQVTHRVVSFGGSCQPGYPNVVAGSSTILYIDSSERPRQPLVKGWPEGYELQAALDLKKGSPFVPQVGLIEQLKPEPFLSFDNLYNEQALERGASWLNLQGLNEKNFALHIPEDLAGHTLTVRAVYRKGDLTLISNPAGPFKIVPLCDQDDSARVLASKIYEAWEVLNHDRAMALADSMTGLGWSDANGWKYAMSAAERMNKYDRQLEYLDRLFADFGVTYIKAGTTVKRLAPGAPPEAKRREVYERVRADLIRVMREQGPQER